MKYEVLNTYDNTGGTYLQGHVGVTYRTLVDLFGPPLRGDGDKVQVEWVIEFYDDEEDRYHIATIYDWKQYDTRPERVLEWNVGGFSPVIVSFLEQAIREHYEAKFAAIRDNYAYASDYDNAPLTPDDLNRRFADSVGMSVRWEG